MMMTYASVFYKEKWDIKWIGSLNGIVCILSILLVYDSYKKELEIIYSLQKEKQRLKDLKKIREKSKKRKLKIQNIIGEELTLEISEVDSILNLKLKIEEIWNIDCLEQALIYQGEELRNNMVFNSLQLSEAIKINLIRKEF